LIDIDSNSNIANQLSTFIANGIQKVTIKICNHNMITVIFNISVDHISLTFLHVTHTAYVSDMENDMLTFSVFFPMLQSENAYHGDNIRFL
jgi:hypothetical protein